MSDAICCLCTVYHAVTDEERKYVAEIIQVSQQSGDDIGVLVAMAALAPCPRPQPDYDN